MKPDVNLCWEEFLDPDVMRPRLIAASIYIAIFEVLNDAIIDRIRAAYIVGFDESGEIVDPQYQLDVLSRNKSPVYASLDWLKDMCTIDDEDVLTFNKVKACRNLLAHELLSTLSSKGLPDDFEPCLTDMVALLRKIEVWWIVNYEMLVSPDWPQSEADEKDIIPGSIAGVRILLDVALGDEKQSRFYYKEIFKPRKSQRR